MALMTPVSLKLLSPRPSVHNVCHTTLSLHPCCNGGGDLFFFFLRALLTWKLRSCLPALAERHSDCLKNKYSGPHSRSIFTGCLCCSPPPPLPPLPPPLPPPLTLPLLSFRSFLLMFSTLDNDCLCHNHHEAYQVK